MYSHIYVRLKASRFAQKPTDIEALRQSVDAIAKPALKGYISEVIAFEPSTTSFAWKLARPVASPDDVPEAIRNVLAACPKVETYSPAIVTRPAGSQPLSGAGALESDFPVADLELPNFNPPFMPEEVPTVQLPEIMTGLDDLLSTLPADSFQTFGMKLAPGRTGCMAPRELAVVLRDAVIARLERDGKHSDRSFTAKRLNEELQTRLTAEATARGAPKTEIDAAKAVKLPHAVFHVDLQRTIGFWSPVSIAGGATVAELANPKLTTRGRAQAEASERTEAGKTDPRTRLADRVVMVKIGEVFLKKGNRSKFVAQLMHNIQHKVGGRGTVKREHHNFVVVPPHPHDGGPQKVFSDEELTEVIDAVKCVAGVDIVNPVLRTGPDMASMVTAVTYLTAIAGANSAYPISAANRVVAPSIVASPAAERAAALALFAPPAARLAAGVSGEELELRAKAEASMLAVTRLGAKIDVHLQEPCPFKSRTTLIKDIAMDARRMTARMLGLPPIPHPGRVYVDECTAEDAARAAKQAALAARFSDLREAMLRADGRAAEADAEAEARTAAAAVEVKRVADEAAAMDDGEENGKTGWVSPRSGVSIRCDVTEGAAYIGYGAGPDFVDAVGGQPTATGGEVQSVVVLLSGGMDSPVAAFSMMRRGMRVVLVHFQNANLADEETVKHKIVQLAAQLSKYQIVTYLHIVPFSAIQDAIIMEVPSPARMLVYRRFMFHVSAMVAAKYNARFLVLGDALGQVASQTASNMFASYINTPLPILSPLVGTNKRDIMETARRIGTYDISALPYGDCCSYFLAKHPLTKIKPEVLAQYEAAVGAKSPGGALSLVRSAHIAAAVLRWDKPGQPMEELKALRPVQSIYAAQVAKLMESCPMRKEGDEEAADAADILREEAAKSAAGAGAGVGVMTDADAEAEAKEAAEGEGEGEEGAASAGADAEADAELGPRAKRPRELYAGGNFLRKLGMPVYNPNVLASLGTGISPASAAAAAAEDAAPAEVEPLTALAPADALALPAPKSTVTRAYLDNAATTPLFPAVLSAMLPYLGGAAFANPSSLHSAGAGTAAVVEEARRVLLQLVNAPVAVAGQTSQEAVAAAANAATAGAGDAAGVRAGKKLKDQLLVFTSGGTEANNMAIVGAARAAVERKMSEVRDAAVGVASARAGGGGVAAALSVFTHLRVHLVTSVLEHSAVLEVVRMLQQSPQLLAAGTAKPATAGGAVHIDVNVKVTVDVSYLRNNRAGIVDVSHLEYLLSQDNARAAAAAAAAEAAGFAGGAPCAEDAFPAQATPVLTLVSLMHANNEVGVLQPLAKVGAVLARHREAAAAVPVLFHSDACQSFGKVHIDVRECALDLLTLNGHKVHGPKGVGALYVRPGVALSTLTVGGGHEGGLRSGTLNVPGVVGLAAAAAHLFGVETSLLDPAHEPLPLTAPLVRAVPARATSCLVGARPDAALPSLKAALLDVAAFVKKTFPRSSVNGPLGAPADAEAADGVQTALPNVLSVTLDRSGWLDASAMIKFMSSRGVAVSSGSACASNAEPAPSHVLLGLGVPAEQANATVRISVGHLTTPAEVELLKQVLVEVGEMKETRFKPLSR
jgi:cysteine sulfinate desulfinase/cysteine desulfurase-like protein/adenylyl- and sulfurtransferase ThiI